VGKTKVLVRWSLDNSPDWTPAFSLRLVCSDQQNILSGSLVDMIFILFLIYVSQFGLCSGLVSANSVIPSETSLEVSYVAGDLGKGEI
jgi:hypothetical protein